MRMTDVFPTNARATNTRATNALPLAERYFELSNAGDLTSIRSLFTDCSTYSSATTGLYLGVDDIMTMQETFFARFQSLAWTVHSSIEYKPAIALFDFTFAGKTLDGNTVTVSGLEYVVVCNNRIQHVEIRNKE